MPHCPHCSQPVLPPSRTCDRVLCREERLRLVREGSGEVERLRRLWAVRARR